MEFQISKIGIHDWNDQNTPHTKNVKSLWHNTPSRYLRWVTDLGQKALCLSLETDVSEIPDRVAIVIGTEASGASLEMLEAADRRVYLPLHGFADSLNLSVAAAMMLQRYSMHTAQ